MTNPPLPLRIRVISLARSQARRERFMQFNRHLPFEFFDAVDGRALAPQDFAATGLFTPGLPYTPGAYGCAMSHQRLWDDCIASGQPLTIAEDDAIFRLDFQAQYQAALQSLPPDWDFVLWGWNLDFVLSLAFMPGISPAVVRFDQEQMRRSIDAFRPLQQRPQLLRLDQCWGIPAYTLSPAGAAKFRARCFPLRPFRRAVPLSSQLLENTGIDSAMNTVYADTASFVAFPPLVVTENDHSISTIQQRRPKGWGSVQAKRLRDALRRLRGRA